MKKTIALLALLATLLVTASASRAATIAQPADGVVATQGAVVWFDWAWATDEYATSSIVFTRTPDIADPVWMYRGGESRADRRIFTDEYGPYLSSNTMLTILGLLPGDWYWRLCNKSIYGEDDKCSYDADVPARRLTVLDGADCYDGFDNDGDRAADFPRDVGCSDYADTDETNPPLVFVQPPPPPAVAEPTLTEGASFDEVDSRLSALLDERALPSRRAIGHTCSRLLRSKVMCQPVWRFGRYRFSGIAIVWLTAEHGEIWTNSTGIIQRRNMKCRRSAAKCFRTFRF